MENESRVESKLEKELLQYPTDNMIVNCIGTEVDEEESPN